jgi:uncharacterized membrane protein
MSVFVLSWVLWNTVGPRDLRYDEFPFIFLTLILSLQASYAAPLILLAQNRQADRDRITLAEDRARNDRSMADTEYLTRELASLRLAMNEVATKENLKDQFGELSKEIAKELGRNSKPDSK